MPLISKFATVLYLWMLVPLTGQLVLFAGARQMDAAAWIPQLPFWLGSIAIWLLTGLMMHRMMRRRLQVLLALTETDEHSEEVSPWLVRVEDDWGELARRVSSLAGSVCIGQHRLSRQEKIDPVTGLPNRAVVPDRIDMAIARASRGQRTFALVIADVLKLSSINGRHGHHCGDVVLKILALRMRSMLRASDSICRFGSDQFLLLIEDGDEQQLLAVVRKLAESVNCHVSAQGIDIRVGVACGVSLYGRHGTAWEELTRRAEVAMLTAKQKSRRLQVYAEGQDESRLRAITLQDDFQPAVRSGHFYLLYQPKLSLVEHQAQQVEALVRWQHVQFGLVGPDEFIPIAERAGQIRILTHWVLERVLRQQHQWLQVGRQIHVSVNLSPLDLADEEILSVLGALTAAYDARPELLTLEVTESAILEDVANAVEVIQSLRERGYQISIDDFGTGYSSLAQLRRLPVRELKIDKSFVMRMRESEEDALIVRSTIDMAHNLGMVVVAEGVESQEVQDLLSTWQCDVIQGYHLARPMEAERFSEWLDVRQPPAQASNRDGRMAGQPDTGPADSAAI